MRNRIKQVVRTGSWLYDDTVPSEVWIIKQNFIEGPAITDEQVEDGYPPYDEDGFFYYAAYGPKAEVRSVRSVSTFCRSETEAIELATKTLKATIEWK